jgi:Leucine-rich repeat (LRR) protein
MDWRYNTIWFDQIDPSRIENLDLRTEKISDLQNKQYVSLRGYSQKNSLLDTFPLSDEVLYLELSFSNLRAFNGIGRLPHIKRLELVHCYKIESDSGLEEVAGSLQQLHFLNSKQFKVGNGLKSLQNIEVLRLNSCSEIDDLDFLYDFPRLLDFRFVDTNVRSGDLSPLIKHQTLRSAGFMDKRHYNMTSEEVDRALESKSSQPLQEFVSKGQWRTFRFLSADEKTLK